jgi:hypothetical protein
MHKPDNTRLQPIPQKQKTDVIEHLKVPSHVGLLLNYPPEKPGRSLASHPKSNSGSIGVTPTTPLYGILRGAPKTDSGFSEIATRFVWIAW